MSVGSGLAVDRTAQVQRLDDSPRVQFEVRANQVRNKLGIYLLSSESIHKDADGFGNTDRVSKLYLAAIGQTGRHGAPEPDPLLLIEQEAPPLLHGICELSERVRELDSADLVVALAREHVMWMRRVHPKAAPRTATLKRLARDLPDDGTPLVDDDFLSRAGGEYWRTGGSYEPGDSDDDADAADDDPV